MTKQFIRLFKTALEMQRFISDAEDLITFGSNHNYCGNILALCIPSSTWEIATGYKYQAWKYPSLLAYRILHFIERSINYPAEIFEMKKLLAVFTFLLVNGCSFYAEQIISGEQVIKPSNPTVKLKMTVSQGTKIKK